MRRSEVLAEESIVCLQKALNHLREIWELIGIPEDQRLQRTEVVKKHIKELLDMMIAEEESLKERLIKSISVCQKELNTLCSELHVEPFQEEGETTILQLEKDLRTQVELMRKQKKERKQELKLLQEQDQELCEILCMPHYDIDSASVPSLEELNQFRQHVTTLRETKLEMQKSQNEAVCEGLRTQIRELWDRLQIPEEEREAVATIMSGSKAKVRKALQLEVDRLEELKMQNMKKVIEAIRVELVQYWDQCFYSQEQRQAFAPFCAEDYTESLLQLHDAEIVRLKNYYEVHKELFEGVQKWEETWRLFLEFERKASDPNRFTNRGGNLLKEEKQRAKLQKMLPKLEEELKARIELWEQEHSKAFMVNGQKFMEYVAEQWEMHRLEKERAKQERQLKNKKQTETEMLYGSAPRTPSKRRGLAPNTPGKARKPVAASTCSGKKTPRTGRHGANKENLELNGSILSGGYPGSAPLQRNFSINSVASTYSEFAKDPSLSDSSTVGLQRELSKASKSDATSGILNSTNIQS
ncbi:protein regulator of cytokinesis 1 isoform X17 [Homo sapiens]|uniref:protein regulator of cytokinesis 1 isoform X17 n=1 Tax=Homo sapiens TaxID=9606 RepID=UPI001FB0F9E6|nr:protein regulator of cytokinesis 1 isoform X17 [Homo sapiens]XP_054235133.1 protein regulator of cytokinesis 1 isoform X17 [Homo sapiens]